MASVLNQAKLRDLIQLYKCVTLFLVFSVPEKFRKSRDSKDAVSGSRVYTRKKKKFTNTINTPPHELFVFVLADQEISSLVMGNRERGFS